MHVCLATTHLLWNQGLGGHAWVFLNWALGLRAAGAKVTLYERMRWADEPERLLAHLRDFHQRMASLGLEISITLLETSEQAEERLKQMREYSHQEQDWREPPPPTPRSACIACSISRPEVCQEAWRSMLGMYWCH